MGCLISSCYRSLIRCCCKARDTTTNEDEEGDTLLDVSQRYFRSPAMIRRDLEQYFGIDKQAEYEGHQLSAARNKALAQAKAPS